MAKKDIVIYKDIIYPGFKIDDWIDSRIVKYASFDLIKALEKSKDAVESILNYYDFRFPYEDNQGLGFRNDKLNADLSVLLAKVVSDFLLTKQSENVKSVNDFSDFLVLSKKGVSGSFCVFANRLAAQRNPITYQKENLKQDISRHNSYFAISNNNPPQFIVYPEVNKSIVTDLFEDNLSPDVKIYRQTKSIVKKFLKNRYDFPNSNGFGTAYSKLDFSIIYGEVNKPKKKVEKITNNTHANISSLEQSVKNNVEVVKVPQKNKVVINCLFNAKPYLKELMFKGETINSEDSLVKYLKSLKDEFTPKDYERSSNFLLSNLGKQVVFVNKSASKKFVYELLKNHENFKFFYSHLS